MLALKLTNKNLLNAVEDLNNILDIGHSWESITKGSTSPKYLSLSDWLADRIKI